MPTKLFIQNMVSLRCKMLVKQELELLDIAYKTIELGEVVLEAPLSSALIVKLKYALHKSGVELMDDDNAVLVEKIITIIIELVHYSDELPKVNFSTLLTEKLGIKYIRLSELFSKTKGTTIEHFIIVHKIERVKELITYDQLNLTEISYKMHYSSVAHLSKQFKQVTGLTPSFFKQMAERRRNNLEDLSGFFE